MSFDAALAHYVARLNEQGIAGRDPYSGPRGRYSVVHGKTYAKVVRASGSQRSAVEFVEYTTGDVYHARSWGKPAQRPVANVYRMLEQTRTSRHRKAKHRSRGRS